VKFFLHLIIVIHCGSFLIKLLYFIKIPLVLELHLDGEIKKLNIFTRQPLSVIVECLSNGVEQLGSNSQVTVGNLHIKLPKCPYCSL